LAGKLSFEKCKITLSTGESNIFCTLLERKLASQNYSSEGNEILSASAQGQATHI
jgi:hypothetical protein